MSSPEVIHTDEAPPRPGAATVVTPVARPAFPNAKQPWVALLLSLVSTVFVERSNGSDRHRNSRKVRKTYRFSKDWEKKTASTTSLLALRLSIAS